MEKIEKRIMGLGARKCSHLILTGCLWRSRYHYDNIKGQSKAIPATRQLEAFRNFCNWSRSWGLLGNDDSDLLLGSI